MIQSPANTEPARQGDPAVQTADSGQNGAAGQPEWLRKYPWLTFLLPLAVFMLIGSLEPTPERPFELLGLSIPYSAYPVVYSVKLALVLASMAAVWPDYRQFAVRVSPLAIPIGVLGVVVWIGLAKLGLESKLFSAIDDVFPSLGLRGWGLRSAFNPFENWPQQPLLAYGFLAVRLVGLVLVVPVIEEFFLRGFVMRYVIAPDWWKVPFGKLTPLSAAVGTLVPMAMHPAELLAAAVWFTLITALMFKTRNIWDCVVAHAVTNLLLGLWVLATGDWYFL